MTPLETFYFHFDFLIGFFTGGVLVWLVFKTREERYEQMIREFEKEMKAEVWKKTKRKLKI